MAGRIFRNINCPIDSFDVQVRGEWVLVCLATACMFMAVLFSFFHRGCIQSRGGCENSLGGWVSGKSAQRDAKLSSVVYNQMCAPFHLSAKAIVPLVLNLCISCPQHNFYASEIFPELWIKTLELKYNLAIYFRHAIIMRPLCVCNQ